MNLRDWFRKFYSVPLLLTVILLLSFWCIIAVRSYQRVSEQHLEAMIQASDLLSLSVQAKDRAMTEILLEILLSQAGASSASLCDGHEQIVGANQDVFGCQESKGLTTKFLERRLPGSNTLVLRAKFDMMKSLSSTIQLLGLGLIFVFAVFYFMHLSKRRIDKDILSPLRNKFLSDEKLKISELNDIRYNIKKIQEIEGQKAVALAIQENNQQVAHDIRSPIQSINALLSMVEIQDSSVKAALEKSVKRANSVANFLLNAEKSTELEKSETYYDLAMVVDDIVVEKSPLFAGGKIILNSPKYFRTQGKLSAESIARILSNVVDNAIQACGDEKVIEITLRQFQKNAEILVRDSGCGIAPEVLNRIGEKGFSKRIREQSSGSGRGVYSAKLALQQIGGNIQFTSSPGVGTTVSIQIPVGSIEYSDQADMILIDNEEMHRLTWKLWAETAGHSLHTFSDPEHFLKDSARYEKSIPVFLDFNLDAEKTAEEFLPAIIKNGFQNVILATAQESFRANQFIGVKDVVGKDPRHSEKFLVRKLDLNVAL